MAKRTIIVAAAMLLAACSGNGVGATASVGQAAPDWQDPLVSGGSLSMAQLRGKPVFMDFFATWCPPCNDEAPEVNAAYEQYKAQGLQVVGVDVQENAQKAKQFVAAHSLKYPAVVDSGTLSDIFSINGMPVGVFIDKSGVIRKIEIGQLSSAQLNADIKSIL
ncbi:MAG TPA: TlpA disulfide reductase family protein [Verrucomicrobiae bacterium]|nr:TlpA disulfide reductase family protein [Verrucomicrobiae bacterium]